MIIPDAVIPLVIELITALYEEIKDPVEVMDPTQEIQSRRNDDGTMSYTIPTTTVQPTLDSAVSQVIGSACSRTAGFVQLTAQVQTDPTTGIGKVY